MVVNLSAAKGMTTFCMTTLAFGLAGGFIVLRGFAKTKESSEQILAAYEGMLKQPTKNKKPQEPKTAT